MRYQDYKRRKSFQYKIKMWFYRLTFRDIEKFMQICGKCVIEIVIMILSFVLIFIIPHFFY